MAISSAKIIWLLPLLALATLSVCGVRATYRNTSQDIMLEPLTLDPTNPQRRRIGDLIFLKAWQMRSNNRDFGGISALAALPRGRFAGVTDAGTLIGFGLTKDDRAVRPFIAQLSNAFGDNKNYADRDSEGIAYDPVSGQFWVSYEVKHAIRRFTPSFGQSNGLLRLKRRPRWPDNKGAETLIRLRDGRFIIISENLEKGLHEGLLFSGDPVDKGTGISRFTYRPPPDYRVTDGTALPDGRLMLLNRRIAFPRGFTAKLTVIDAGTVRETAEVTGKVIATLAAPLLVDNMEGIALTQEGDGVIIWLISDNNFNIWQRTLLMKFRLSERGKGTTGSI